MVRAWIKAARLRTLPLAISSILVGTAIASNYGEIDLSLTLLTLLSAVFLQVLSNFANDYGDAESGVDSAERDGPKRMVQSGILSKSAMKRAIQVMALLSFISGCTLIGLAFPDNWMLIFLFLLLGVGAIIASIKYTVGSNPYGYVGLGDLFVFLFFGLIAVLGTSFLQTKEFYWIDVLPATSLGLFAVGVLNVNNVRDIESDKLAGKFSIPVRIGKQKAAIYHAIILMVGVMCSLTYVIEIYSNFIELVFVISIPLFIINILKVASLEGKKLDPYLKQMAISTLLFSVLFAIGQFAN